MNKLGLAGLWCAAAAVLIGAPAAAEEAGDSASDMIVVTGSRSGARTSLEASAPISVVGAADIADLGFGDLSRSLQYLEPTLNYPRASTTATAANSRSITLRGLSPDQTLVLVNGTRRHSSSILNINNAVGRGAAGVDLDLIPASAIERVEILRDGAAAQYGSDAIAGVVNLILREADEGGMAFAQAGITEEGDGETFTFGGWSGFALPGGGHLTVSGEFRDQERTNRANVDQRFGRVTYQVGDPDIELGTVALDAAAPLFGGELYGFVLGARKDSVNPAGFRVPTFAPTIYPDGFLPKINALVTDWSTALGWEGEVGAGWSLNLSHTIGADRAAFSVSETVNASLGAASPTDFDSGAVEYRQYVTDAVLTRPFPDLMAGANLALGVQHRRESYESEEGEPDAFFGAGADGFAGFAPAFEGERDAFGVFVDAELNPTEALLLGLAARYDEYDDFGGEPTVRARARYELTEQLALRASIGTGFRAPSLQQQQFRLVSGALSSGGALTTVGTLPVSDPVAQLLGATALEPETSRNISMGAVFDVGDFSFTADWFRVEIDDRIVLSEQFGGTAVTNILLANGITNFQQVRFFTNAASTTTEGYEAMLRYRTEFADGLRLNLGLGYAHAETQLDALRANATLPALPYLQTRSLVFLLTAQPEDKATFEVELERGPWAVQGNISYFGPYQFAGFGNTLVQDVGASTVFDASLRFDFNESVRFSAGVQNLSDVAPDQPIFNTLPSIISATGGSFSSGEETPIGVNGRSYFVRLEARF